MGERADIFLSTFNRIEKELAQLRNAIVHDQVADDFVIAEPNDWAVTRIKQIEESLLRPEKVLPRFGKKVTGF